VAHTGLCGEMDHDVEAVLGEEAAQQVRRLDALFYGGESRMRAQHLVAFLF